MFLSPATKRFQLLEIIEDYWYKYTVFKMKNKNRIDGQNVKKKDNND